MNVAELMSVMEEVEKTIFNKDMVVQLSKEDVSDYDRGVISGKISIINSINRIIDERTKGKNKAVRK